MRAMINGWPVWGSGLARLLFLVALAGACAPAVAQREESTRARDPYVGVVTDATVTIVGQDFYRAFVTVWREQPLSDRYTLSIVERPSARWGSLVWIEYANRRLYSSFLSPGRRDAVRQSAMDAARQVYQSAVDADVERLIFRDPDLAGDEF